MTQWVYGFGGGSAEGDASMKNCLAISACPFLPASP